MRYCKKYYYFVTTTNINMCSWKDKTWFSYRRPLYEQGDLSSKRIK